MVKILFSCRNCGSNVVDCRRDGRYYEHRGIVILLPKEFNIPRCVNPDCLQEWFSDQLIKDLEQALEDEYLEHEALIKSVIELYKHRQ